MRARVKQQASSSSRTNEHAQWSFIKVVRKYPCQPHPWYSKTFHCLSKEVSVLLFNDDATFTNSGHAKIEYFPHSPAKFQITPTLASQIEFF